VLAVLEWHQQRMSSFWASKNDTASSSAVHHLQGAPVLKGMCYVSVIVHYKHDEGRGGKLLCVGVGIQVVQEWGLEQSSE
jgi:hypothetical protein